MQHEGRHRRPAQPRLLTWLDTGRRGLLSVLWFLMAVSVIAVVALVTTSRSERVADGLAEASVRETVEVVEVYVDHAVGRVDGWYEVEAVRVRLAGAPGWTDLRGVDAADDSMIEVPMEEGWQQPNRLTSYQPPLEVLAQRDEAGKVTIAMAATDFDYLRENAGRDQRTSALVVAGSVGGGVVLMLANVALHRWAEPRASRWWRRRHPR